jgi:NADPH-dependent 2,4-dienoyl-CoA reductase/sulfur reductase-like enzyme
MPPHDIPHAFALLRQLRNPTRVGYDARGIKRQETQMIKVIVIGAGVMGASTAYRLAQAGTAVTVLEATRIGGGTSGISFAWTCCLQRPRSRRASIQHRPDVGCLAHDALGPEPLLGQGR